MLLILADVYRIATFRASEAAPDRHHEARATGHRQHSWLRIAGLLR